jgi:hypothetical protein
MVSMRGIPLTRLRKDVFFLKPFQAAEVDLVPAEAFPQRVPHGLTMKMSHENDLYREFTDDPDQVPGLGFLHSPTDPRGDCLVLTHGVHQREVPE